MDVMEILSIASRWVHIVAVVVAIGGAFFMRLALQPAANEVLSTDEHQRLRTAVMVRWKIVVHICVALLIVTGGFNFYMAFHDEVSPMPYHAIFGVKLILAFIVFFYAIALSGSSPGFASIRENSRKWLGVVITLALVVVLLSGVLKSVHETTLVATG